MGGVSALQGHLPRGVSLGLRPHGPTVIPRLGGATSRFAARIDALPLVEITSSELRSRIAILDVELAQLAHDEDHVEGECIGLERVKHVACIARERIAAMGKRARYSVELSGRL